MKPEGGEITLTLFRSNGGEGEKEEISTENYSEEITAGSYIEGGEEVKVLTETDIGGEDITGFCRVEEIETGQDGGGEEEIKKSVNGKGEGRKTKKRPHVAANYRKSKATIVKKARELSTLCDIPVGLAIINPKDGTTETWPESLPEIKNIWNANLEKFQMRDDRWTFSETNAESSQPLKIVDNHDEIVNDLNSKLASVERLISSYWQERQNENVENCSNIRDQEKKLDEQERKRRRPE